VLQRVTRTITRTAIAVGGRRALTVRPGRVVDVRVRVAPAGGGPVDVVLERFDPLSGWRYVRTIGLRTAAGVTHWAFRPPAEGRWRVSATFRGTRRDAPSVSGRASVLVARPLGTG
jgi:hypothetical protein